MQCPQELKTALNKEGFSWQDLYQSAEQIILFGSRAFGIANKDSDWDLLLIGNGKTKRTKSVDLVWVSKEKSLSINWLGDELAMNVFTYGKWLKGQNNWKIEIYPSPAGLKRKYRVVLKKLKALMGHWDSLNSAFRKKHITDIRKHMQRYESMLKGEIVDVTPMYNSRWQAIQHKKDAFSKMAFFCDIDQSLITILLSKSSSPQY